MVNRELQFQEMNYEIKKKKKGRTEHDRNITIFNNDYNSLFNWENCC